MNKLHSIKLILLWFIILLGVVAIAGWMILTIRTNAAMISELSDEIQGALQRSASLEKFRRIALDSQDEKEKLERYLVSSNDTVSFIEEVEQVAKDLGVEVRTDAVTTKAIPDQNRNLLVLSIHMQGSWQHVMRVLDLLETLPHKVVMSKLSLSRQDGGEDSGIMWVADVEINAAMTK